MPLSLWRVTWAAFTMLATPVETLLELRKIALEIVQRKIQASEEALKKTASL
jgi:hypothetical protein